MTNTPLPLPGDTVLQGSVKIMDRTTDIAAAPQDVWPWIVQLGKGRAGWYAPLWLDKAFVSPRKRGARQIMPQFQQLAVGDIVPDWGPGSLKVLSIDAGHSLVYASVQSGQTSPNDYLFTWAHVLSRQPDGTTRLHTRLRMRQPRNRLLRLALPLGDLFDYLTIVAMYAGLKQRLAKPGSRT